VHFCDLKTAKKSQFNYVFLEGNMQNAGITAKHGKRRRYFGGNHHELDLAQLAAGDMADLDSLQGAWPPPLIAAVAVPVCGTVECGWTNAPKPTSSSTAFANFDQFSLSMILSNNPNALNTSRRSSISAAF